MLNLNTADESNEMKKPTFHEIIAELEKAMNDGPEAEKDFINARVQRIMEDAKSVEKIGPMSCPHLTGAIKPDTEIKRSEGIVGFCIDDPEIYNNLLDNIREIQMLEGYKQHALRKIIPMVILYTVIKYFGNTSISAKDLVRNEETYSEATDFFEDPNPIHLTELKGKNFAVCAEKAALTQNLAAFLGLDPEIIFGECIPDMADESVNLDLHVYNLFQIENRKYLFDPANPHLYRDLDGHIVTYEPAIYRLTDEQVQELEKKGGKVSIVRCDFQKDKQGGRQRKDRRLTYKS